MVYQPPQQLQVTPYEYQTLPSAPNWQQKRSSAPQKHVRTHPHSSTERAGHCRAVPHMGTWQPPLLWATRQPDHTPNTKLSS
jgi:hypothetical protein